MSGEALITASLTVAAVVSIAVSAWALWGPR